MMKSNCSKKDKKEKIKFKLKDKPCNNKWNQKFPIQMIYSKWLKRKQK